MTENERQFYELNATKLACFLAALQGDTEGLGLMLDAMTWPELRYIAAAALRASAQSTVSANTVPSREELDGMTSVLKAEVASLRAKAMEAG